VRIWWKTTQANHIHDIARATLSQGVKHRDFLFFLTKKTAQNSCYD